MSLKKTLITSALGRMIFRELRVVRVAEVAPTFWRLDLAGDALRGASVTPGDKVQILLGDDTRTYSPFAVDPRAGTMSILSYAHGGSSPGAQWGPTAREGDRLQGLGPRGSLALPSLGAEVVLVGDETSFATARALHELRGSAARYVFEVDATGPAARALAHLELPSDGLVARRPGDAHHADLEAKVRAALRATASLALTGKATSIQALRASFKARPVAHATQKVKPYWSPGKRGLD